MEKQNKFIDVSYSFLACTKVCNQPQPPTIIRNHPPLSKTTHNHPQPSATTHNHPQLSTTIHNYSHLSVTAHNHPQPPIATCNHPQLPTTIHKHTKKPKLVTSIYLDCTISIITEHIFDTDTDAAAKHKAATIERCFLK